jgi:four helix bundle protein
MHDFKKLNVWKRSRFLVSEVYGITRFFPKEEMFGLTAQMRRAVISIASNIAEGGGRGTNKDFVRFLDIAQGSSFELEAQLILSFDLNYISEETLEKILKELNEVQKMMRGFSKTLQE